jgi:hypothetical protein
MNDGRAKTRPDISDSAREALMMALAIRPATVAINNFRANEDHSSEA